MNAEYFVTLNKQHIQNQLKMKHKFRKGDRVVINNTRGSNLTKGGIYKLTYASEDFFCIGMFTFDRNDVSLHKPAPRNTAVIRRTRNNGFRTTLVGKNGEVMFVSEVYTTKAKAIKTARSVVPDFEIVDKAKNK